MTEERTHLFRFSLGPVQSFIGDARRVRDYWAGSFLLSWLTAEALNVAWQQGAEILSPLSLSARNTANNDSAVAIENDTNIDAVFQALAFPSDDHRPDYLPTFPNIFRARVSENFDPKALEATVRNKWRALAQAIWEEVLSKAISHSRQRGELPDWFDHSFENSLKERYEEQTGLGVHSTFWEIIWVMGVSPQDQKVNDEEDGAEHKKENPAPDGRWLAERKSWRKPAFLGDVGLGDRCSLMPDWRELSGFNRSIDREKQQQFWNVFRDLLHLEDTSFALNGKKGEPLDLRPDERLSAPALVKRLFPRLSNAKLKETIGWVPASRDAWSDRLRSGPKDKDQNVNVRFWPSTAAISAIPWMQKAVGLANDTELVDDKSVASKMEGFISGTRGFELPLRVAERQSRLWERSTFGGRSITGRSDFRQPVRKSGMSFVDKFVALDGKLFYANEYENDQLFDSFQATNETSLATVQQDLASLIKAMNGAKPSSYYAMIQMDGDSIGTMDDSLRAKGLELFARKVQNLFEGSYRPDIDVTELSKLQMVELIYCTADDVLLLAPVDVALSAASRVRQAFETSFASVIDGKSKTHPPTISASIIFARYSVALGWVKSKSDETLKSIAKKKNGRDSVVLSILRPSGQGPEWVSAWKGHGEVDVLLRIYQHLLAEKEGKNAPWGENSFVYRVEKMFDLLFFTDDHYDNEIGRNVILEKLKNPLFGTMIAAQRDKNTEDFCTSNESLQALLDLLAPVPNQYANPIEPTTSGLHILKFLASNIQKSDVRGEEQ